PVQGAHHRGGASRQRRSGRPQRRRARRRGGAERRAHPHRVPSSPQQAEDRAAQAAPGRPTLRPFGSSCPSASVRDMSHGPSRRQDPGNLVWIDLEMTGLDPEVDVILQAALIVTDRELQPLEEYVVDVWQPPAALESMVPFVRSMHETTGLLARLPKSTVDVRAAERHLLERVAGWCPYRPILCGNSIGSDRKFIDRYMPALAGYLHYRMLDVSSLKILAQLW